MTEQEALTVLRAADPVRAASAAAALWEMWHRSGRPDLDALLRQGIEAMEAQQLAQAEKLFSRLIEIAPAFAEGWNKRATAYYLLGEWRRSAADCDEVLRRNPQHFGALSGYGMIWLQLDEPARALERFEQALAVNPNLESVQTTVDALRALLIKQRREAI